MKKRIENLKVLKSELQDGLTKAESLQKKLGKLKPEQITKNTDEESLIAIAYYLSGIYSNFEELFTKIAKEFENKIEDTSQWHAELLYRMSLNIEGLRPAVISKQSKEVLDELRRFRHMFRFSYAFELDWEKMLITIKRWNHGSKEVYANIVDFMKELDNLDD